MSEDEPRVRALYFQLVRGGFDPWLDKHGLKHGDEWEIKIEEAIKKCDVALICISNHFKRRGYFHRECGLIARVASEFPEGEIYLIPVLLDNFDIPDSLAKYQAAELFKRNGLKQLLEVLQNRKPLAKGSSKPKLKTKSIEGVYLATGNNEDGSDYDGKATIAKLGETYFLTWEVGEDRYESKGTLIGKTLLVRGAFKVEYQINSDGSLVGSWGVGGWEKLQRLPSGFDW